jgi:hypothetical protein
MNPSKLNPNIFNGEERSGGYLVRNEKPTSANSPQWRGKLYLVGVGWYWISAWEKNIGNGDLLALRGQEMTDEQAAKFCAPKPRRGEKRPETQLPLVPEDSYGSAADDSRGIPF